jgi:hypothetical protein
MARTKSKDGPFQLFSKSCQNVSFFSRGSWRIPKVAYQVVAQKIDEPVKSQNPVGFEKSSSYGAPISAA